MKSPPLWRGARRADAVGRCALGNDYEDALAIHQANSLACGAAIRNFDPLRGGDAGGDACQVLVNLLDDD
jgi:hypothetical protein